MKANKTMGIVRTARWALGAAVLLCVGVVHAAGELQLDNQVFQEIEVQTEDGRIEVQQVPAARVVPGDEVTYVINYRNVGDQPLDDVAITNPIPVQLVYVDASGVVPVTEVSVDDGVEYGPLAELTVPGPDGEPRPATAEDVTHLRWIIPVLPAGADGAVSFTARVR